MRVPRIALRAVLFGGVAEAAALAVSFGLYSLHHGREPMEPPFNWAATVIQIPGVFVSEALTRAWAMYTGWFQWGIVYCVQALLWSMLGFAFFYWRAREIT